MSLLLWVLLPTLLALWWKRLICEPRAEAEAAPRDSFIVFRLDALGDLVLTTPLFRELKRTWPYARITVVVQDAYKSLLVTNPYVDEVLTVRAVRSRWLPKGACVLISTMRLYWRTLRRRQVDVAISPRWDTDEHLATLLCLLTTARLRVGYTESASPGKRRYNRGFDRVFDTCLGTGPLQHELQRNLVAIEALGGSVRDSALEIYLTSQDREYATRALGEAPDTCVVAALGIGAQSPGRRWPLERYAACIAELSKQYAVQTVITCAPSEHAEAVRLAEMLPGRPIISDSFEIRETCALLERCDLFIGNDTGAAHLAAAMNCPTIVISRHPRMGDPEHPNSSARFAPYCALSRVLQPERGLDGCTKRCVKTAPHCIEQVSVAEVVAAAEELLMLKDQRNTSSAQITASVGQ
jgi:ADP-heptose:LPS heptosyltransferase